MQSIVKMETAIVSTIYAGGKTDTKGRVEGLIVEIWEVEMIERPADALTYYKYEPGYYFVACITKTKNGKKFGASQPRQLFKTNEERQTAILKRLKKAGI